MYRPILRMSSGKKSAWFLRRQHFFQGTIRENLSWGREDATDEEMWEALTTAQAREIVEKKDGQLDFKLEQNGRNLSGGQRQRLTIARALVKKPEILILDDSASALDFATDAALRKSLHQLGGNTTTFLVSQRAASIRQADLILVLDDGQLAGKGTHQELVSTCETYREIFFSQFPEERIKYEKANRKGGPGMSKNIQKIPEQKQHGNLLQGAPLYRKIPFPSCLKCNPCRSYRNFAAVCSRTFRLCH